MMTAFSTQLYQRAAEVADDERARHTVDRCLVDWAGCALAGSRHPAAGTIAPVEPMFGASDDCTVIGQARRSGQLAAALENGLTSHVLDYDDVHPRMTGHPAVVVFPALIALAEARHLNGRQVARGAIAGYEIAAQLGRFNIVGTAVGVYLLLFISTGLELLGAASWVADVFNGVALIIAIGFARFASGSRTRA